MLESAVPNPEAPTDANDAVPYSVTEMLESTVEARAIANMYGPGVSDQLATDICLRPTPLCDEYGPPDVQELKVLAEDSKLRVPAVPVLESV
jgi:hypothetical protein